MTKCSRCNTKIVKHLWIVGTTIYCSPRCERYREKWENPHRHSDKVVEKIGIAGLKKERKW